MKLRTAKKRIHRHIKYFARHYIPHAFKNSLDRKEWIKEMCEYHIKRLKVKKDGQNVVSTNNNNL